MNTCWRSLAKEGWFCPSCHQKKVQIFGAMLAESILAAVPHRHFTFTIPEMLRPYFRFHRGLLKQLCRIASRHGLRDRDGGAAIAASSTARAKGRDRCGKGAGETVRTAAVKARLRKRFQPVDVISVVRHNASLGKGNFNKAAEEGNFFLRGFNYLFIMKKVDEVAARQGR